MNREQIIEGIVRLAEAERHADASLRPDLRAVRESLEDTLGETVRPAEAARLLGVSQPALKKWLDRGEISSVLTRSGRREIPISELIGLVADVEEARRSGWERALGAVIRDRSRRANETVDFDRLLGGPRRSRTHRTPENVSLAYHRLVAERLTPALVKEARARLRRWRKNGRIDPRWAEAWDEVLDEPIDRIARTISSGSVRSRELRQTSPFAGLLTEQERRRVLESVR